MSHPRIVTIPIADMLIPNIEAAFIELAERFELPWDAYKTPAWPLRYASIGFPCPVKFAV